MKQTKKNKDLLSFINVANAVPVEPESKLAKVLIKQVKVFNSALESYNNELEVAQIESCSVDEKGNVLKGEKGEYVYSKEGLRSLSSKNKELLSADVEVEVFLKAEHIADLKQPALKDYFCTFLGIEEASDEENEATVTKLEITN